MLQIFEIIKNFNKDVRKFSKKIENFQKLW